MERPRKGVEVYKQRCKFARLQIQHRATQILLYYSFFMQISHSRVTIIIKAYVKLLFVFTLNLYYIMLSLYYYIVILLRIQLYVS